MSSASLALSLLRIVAAIGFFSHGGQKLFGWFGGMPVELLTLPWFAGVIEVVGGAALALGIFTRPVAFLASGEMAVAYFWAHARGSGSIWWWENRGELAMLYCFIWLYFAAAGAGPLSLDGLRRKGGRR